MHVEHIYICIRLRTYIQIYRPSSYPPPADAPHRCCRLPAQTLRLSDQRCLKLRIFQKPEKTGNGNIRGNWLGLNTVHYERVAGGDIILVIATTLMDPQKYSVRRPTRTNLRSYLLDITSCYYIQSETLTCVMSLIKTVTQIIFSLCILKDTSL